MHPSFTSYSELRDKLKYVPSMPFSVLLLLLFLVVTGASEGIGRGYALEVILL